MSAILFDGQMPNHSFVEKVSQGDPLYDDPLICAHRPRESARRLGRLDGGDIVRWFVQLDGGCWHPHGPLMRITAERGAAQGGCGEAEGGEDD